MQEDAISQVVEQIRCSQARLRQTDTFGRVFRPVRKTRAERSRRIGFDAIRPRIMSWIGHARHANTYRLRTDLFDRMRFQRAAAKPSLAPGRDEEQSTGERPLGEP